MSDVIDGHTGLKNEKRKEKTIENFNIALSYLIEDRSTAYFVIHVYSNTFDYSPYLQRSNIQPNRRKNFLERLGFKFYDGCNILQGEKCYYKVIGKVDSEESIKGKIPVGIFYNRFEKFAEKIGEVFNEMHNVDKKLYEMGFELPWKNLGISPLSINERERVYPEAHEYDFYKDIKNLIGEAKNEVCINDAYVDEEVLNLYLDKLPTGVSIRILTKKPQGIFNIVAKKFKSQHGAKFEVKVSEKCHDRLIFIDNKCFVLGQSIKDAAKKPTYLVQVMSYDLFKNIFEKLWREGDKTV